MVSLLVPRTKLPVEASESRHQRSQPRARSPVEASESRRQRTQRSSPIPSRARVEHSTSTKGESRQSIKPSQIAPKPPSLASLGKSISQQLSRAFSRSNSHVVVEVPDEISHLMPGDVIRTSARHGTEDSLRESSDTGPVTLGPVPPREERESGRSEDSMVAIELRRATSHV